MLTKLIRSALVQVDTAPGPAAPGTVP